jgi:hypothetical protein
VRDNSFDAAKFHRGKVKTDRLDSSGDLSIGAELSRLDRVHCAEHPSDAHRTGQIMAQTFAGNRILSLRAGCALALGAALRANAWLRPGAAEFVSV